MAQRKFKPRNIDQNPIEAIRNIGESIVDSVKDNVTKGITEDLLEQTLSWDALLGTNVADRARSHTSGDLIQGQEISLSKKRADHAAEKPHQEKKAHIEAGWDYTSEIIHGEKRIAQSENRELNQKISEIIFELKRLAKTSKELEITFREVTVEQRIVNPGKYHLNFFDWVLTTIRSARMRVEDSKHWAGMFGGKNSKKNYWSLYKKHGTSFGLSGERTPANQTG